MLQEKNNLMKRICLIVLSTALFVQGCIKKNDFNFKNIVYTNNSFCQMCGYSEPELLGKSFSDLFFFDEPGFKGKEIYDFNMFNYSGAYEIKTKNKNGDI